MALSTAEAETIAATEAIKQVMHLRLILQAPARGVAGARPGVSEARALVPGRGGRRRSLGALVPGQGGRRAAPYPQDTQGMIKT